MHVVRMTLCARTGQPIYVRCLYSLPLKHSTVVVVAALSISLVMDFIITCTICFSLFFFVHLCVVAVVVAVVVDVIIILCLHLLRWNYCSSARLYHPHDLHPFFTAHCLHTFLFDGCCWCRHCNGDGVERGGGAVGVQFGELLRIKPKSKSTPIIPHAYTHTRTSINRRNKSKERK